jgi:hypothetical protein
MLIWLSWTSHSTTGNTEEMWFGNTQNKPQSEPFISACDRSETTKIVDVPRKGCWIKLSFSWHLSLSVCDRLDMWPSRCDIPQKWDCWLVTCLVSNLEFQNWPLGLIWNYIIVTSLRIKKLFEAGCCENPDGTDRLSLKFLSVWLLLATISICWWRERCGRYYRRVLKDWKKFSALANRESKLTKLYLCFSNRNYPSCILLFLG